MRWVWSLWVGLILGFASFGSLDRVLAQSPTRIPSPPVMFNGQRVPIDSTWVSQNGVTYVALRDVVRFFGGQIVFLRHLDAYEVTVPTQSFSGSTARTLRIFTHAPDMMVSGKLIPYRTATFFFDGQFYVPFSETLDRVGYQTVSFSDGGIRIQAPGQPTAAPMPPARPVKPVVPILPVSPKPLVPTRPIALATANPSPAPATASVSIAFGPRVYTLTGRHVSENGVVFVDLDAALRREGVTVIRRPDGVELVHGQVVYRLTSGNAEVKVAFSGKIEIKKIPHPLRMINNTPYLSVPSIASILQLGVVWEADRNRVHFVNRLTQMRIEKSPGGGQLVLGAARSIYTQSPKILPDDHGVVLDLPDLQLPNKEWIQDAKEGPIRRVIAQQVTPTRVRLTALFSGDYGVSQLVATASGAVMSVAGRVTDISQSVVDGRVLLRISGVGMTGVQIWRIPGTDTLVIDVPGTYSTVPQVVRPIAEAPIASIRASQFSLKPPATRVVVGLDARTSFDVKARLADRIELSFPLDVTPVVTPTASPRPGRIPTVSSVPSVSVTPTRTPLAVTAHRSIPATPSVSVAPGTHPPSVRPVVIRAAPPRQALSRKIIVIDPGHGGGDPGGIAADNTFEKTLTIDISRRLKTALEAHGAVVVMCRQNDENPSLKARSDMGNFNNADLFVSVHINSFFHSYANGTETYYYKPSDKPLSVAVHQEMVKALGFRDNGVKRARLYVLRNTRMPAVLVEPGFITNPLEFERMSNPEVRQKIANAITTGILNYVAQPRDADD